MLKCLHAWDWPGRLVRSSRSSQFLARKLVKTEDLRRSTEGEKAIALLRKEIMM